MNKSDKDEEETLFKPIKIHNGQRKHTFDVDLNALYERAFSELGLQQSKRDQIVTLYLAMFSFLIPFALSLDAVTWQVKGCIFLAAAIVGVLFALVIVRYRIYKEIYWLCCESITVLFGIKNHKIDKKMVQSVFFWSVHKKGKKYLEGEKPEIFNKKKYIKDNLFSSESIYFFIHILLTALIFGLSVGLMCSLRISLNIIIGGVSGAVLFVILSIKYFRECIAIYNVLTDKKEDSFNKIFSKAWFLHFYI